MCFSSIALGPSFFSRARRLLLGQPMLDTRLELGERLLDRPGISRYLHTFGRIRLGPVRLSDAISFQHHLALERASALAVFGPGETIRLPLRLASDCYRGALRPGLGDSGSSLQ